MKQILIFIFVLLGICFIWMFICDNDKPDKASVESFKAKRAEQTTSKYVPPKELIDYEITKQWDLGMDVSIPHSATDAQIRQLNSELKHKYFSNNRGILIRYHCLDHPDLKETIALYTYNANTGYNKLEISSPTPGNRYPYKMTPEAIKKLH